MNDEFNELDVLATSVKNKQFLARFASRIAPTDFQNEIYGVVWGVIRDLWLEYYEMPTFNAVDSKIIEKVGGDYFYKEDIPVLIEAMRAVKSRSVLVGLTFDQVEDWAAARARVKMQKATQRAVFDGDPSAIEEAYAEYISSLATVDEEKDFFDRWGEIAEDSARLQTGFISTGHRDLDKIIGGGYLKGDLFMLWGVDGLGKSWLAIQFGMHAITQGRRVLHLTNEMLKQDVEERYLALFSQVNTQAFTANVDHIRNLEKTHKNFVGLLKVQFMNLGSTSADIRAILQTAIIEGRPYDLVILDYVDKFEPARNLRGDDWLRLEHLFEELSELVKMTDDHNLNPAICAITHANAAADGKAMPQGRRNLGRSQAGKSKNVDFSLVMGQDAMWAEQDIVQVTRVKNPRGRPVEAKMKTCLLKHLKDHGAFVSIGFEEVETNAE